MRAMPAMHSDLECSALQRWRRRREGDDASGSDDDDDDDDDDDVADLVFQAIRILSYKTSNRSSHSFIDSSHDDAKSLAVTYDSYAARLIGMRRTKRTADGIKRTVKSALRSMPKESSASRVPPSELVDVLNRHQCNVFGVLGAGGRSVGLSSFIGAMHLTNHSCLPNAAFDSTPVFGGRLLGDDDSNEFEFAAFGLRAIVDIPEGEEICHCYAGSADGPSQRLQYLRDHHGFECVCERCSCDDPAEEADLADRLDAVRCICDGCGTGLSYPLPSARGVDVDGDEVVRQCVLCAGQFCVEDY